ncbi:MAG: LamG domain-containing protein, partial [Nanoarchaeota archaeon]
SCSPGNQSTEICNDGKDNDCDSFTDVQDSDCSIPLNCAQGHTNNGDGTCTALLSGSKIIDDGTIKYSLIGYEKENTNLLEFSRSNSAAYTKRSYIEWNISEIPDSLDSISSLALVYSSNSAFVSGHPAEIKALILNRASVAILPVEFQNIFTEIESSSVYVSSGTFPTPSNNQKEFLIFLMAKSDFTNQLIKDWFSIGIKSGGDNFGEYQYSIYSKESPQANPVPSLEVKYTPASALGPSSPASLNFQFSNDYVLIGNNSDFSDVCLNGCSFSTWINPALINGGETIIGRSDVFSDNFFRLSLLAINGNNPQSTISLTSDGVQGCTYTSPANSIYFNKFQQFVGVYNKTHVSIYINGALKGSTQCPFSNLDVSAWQRSEKTYIGNRESGGNPAFGFKGNIDEVRIYNRALSSNELLEINNSGRRANSSLTSNGLYSWYRLDKGQGSWEPDYTLQGKNGLISGATWSST